jgi:hypothetical protein
LENFFFLNFSWNTWIFSFATEGNFMVEMKRGVTVDLTCAGLAFFLPEEEVGGQNGSANGGEFVTKNT